MGVYPGEGKGEELTPALTPVMCTGAVVSVVPVSLEQLETVSSVHCDRRTDSHFMVLRIQC